MSTLDSTDLAILRAMQSNARLTTKEIATMVHLSSTPVFERIKRMEREGIIKQYVTILDAEKLNRGFTVFTSVKLRHCTMEAAQDFIHRVEGLREVTECYNVSGTTDYLLKVHCSTMKDYQRFVLEVLGTCESVGHIESAFVMEEIKREYSVIP